MAALAEKLGDPGRLWAIYSLGFFVRLSVLEGIATLSAVLYAIVPSWIPVAVAAMVLLAIVGNYPTWLGVSDWIAQRLARLEQERALHALSAAHLASGSAAAARRNRVFRGKREKFCRRIQLVGRDPYRQLHSAGFKRVCTTEKPTRRYKETAGKLSAVTSR